MIIWRRGDKHLLAAHWGGGAWVVHLPWWSIYWRRPNDRGNFSELHCGAVIGRRGVGYRLQFKPRA